MLNFVGYCEPVDIVVRLFRRKFCWFHGPPKIDLKGELNSFGVLSFDFGDEILKFEIWIKDRNKILDAAHFAVVNYNSLHQEIMEH